MRHLSIAVLALAVVSPLGGCTESTIVVRTVSNRTGAPITGVSVQVGSQSWATTDAKGEATFAASSPFTVRSHQTVTWPSGSTEDYVQVLGEQSGSEITVTVEGLQGWGAENGVPKPPWYGATVAGSVSGRSGASSAETSVRQTYDGTWLGVPAQDGSFDMQVIFQSSTGTTVTLRAFEADQDANGDVTHLYSMGAAQVSVVPDGRATGVSIQLAPVTEGAVAGSVSLDPTLAGASVRAGWQMRADPYGGMPINGPRTAIDPAGFSITAPSVSDGAIWLRVNVGWSAHSRRVTVPSSGLAFAIPAAPALVEPAEGATFDHTIVLRWTTPEAGGTSTVNLYCSPASGASASFTLVTTGSQAVVPDDIPGVTLVSGTQCTWDVGWCADTDAGAETRCSSSPVFPSRTLVVK